MDVLITGVGNAFTKVNFGSSALIRAPEGFVLIDCPDPIHRVLHESVAAAGWSVSAHQIHDLIITHLHGDHANGLEALGFLTRDRREKHPNEPRPQLHTSKPAADRLWEKLAPAMDGAGGGESPGPATRTIEDYYKICILTPGHDATISGLRVRCRFTQHPVPTIGLLLTDGSWTLGWSGDTPFEHAHIEWLAEADLIVHECHPGRAHTSIDELNALPDALRAKIHLIHLPDDFDEGSTDMRVLKQGDVLRGPAGR